MFVYLNGHKVQPVKGEGFDVSCCEPLLEGTLPINISWEEVSEYLKNKSHRMKSA